MNTKYDKLQETKMESQKDRVGSLEILVADTEQLLNELRKQYDTEVAKLREMCPHENFIATPDFDYHKPGYYYTCECCGYLQKYKPSNILRQTRNVHP